MSSDFHTTSWSLVLATQDRDAARSRAALESLCKVYWPPLYAFLRRRGRGRDEAADLTQAFFLHLLDKRGLDNLRPENGRFRSFLLASLKNLLADERAHEQALKRGAGKSPLRLDVETAERSSRLEPADGLTPERIFERQWALTVLGRVLGKLRDEFDKNGEARKFERLKGFITGEQPALPYRRVAADLEITEDAVKMAVHRLRKRFGQGLRAEIAGTVSGPEEVDDEIRYLLDVLRA